MLSRLKAVKVGFNTAWRVVPIDHEVICEGRNMGQEILPDAQANGQMKKAALTRGIVWGLVGGLAGTIVMDLVLVGVLSAVGLPAVISFSTIGDTAAGFLALLGITLAGGFPLGAAVHYLLGLVLGAIFGAIVAHFDTFRVDRMKKSVVFAVLYIEVLSQPILATSPIILTMTTSQTLQWFGVSAVMHLIWGVVLGVVVSYGLDLAPAFSMREKLQKG